MAFKVGEAPWEQNNGNSFKVGEAPWEKQEDRPMVSGKGLLQGLTRSLPTLGGIGGGLLGSALGPLGMVGGAGLGSAGGKALENVIESFTEPERVKSGSDMYADLAKESLLGAAGEGGGQLISKGLVGAARLLPKRSATAPAIEAAGEKLGVTPSAGMTTDSYYLKGLENDLSKSPTIGGALTRRETNPIYQKIDDVTQKSLGDATSLSPYESGVDIKKGLISDISERQAPISMAYDDVAGATKNIELNPESVGRVSRNIEKIDSARLFPEDKAIAESYSNALRNAKSADDLKVIKTRAKEALRDQTASYTQKNIASEALTKLDRLETNTIMREAIALARTPGQGKAIGKEIVGSLKTAAKEYRAMMGDIGTLARGSKVTSGKYGVSNITKEIDLVPAEKLPDMIFKTNDTEFLTFLKDKHPQVFEAARKQKLAGIFKKSLSPQDGTVSSRKFLQAVKDLGPEVRVQLFGKEASSIKDIDTLVKSIPEMFNPSGTARSLQMKQTFNPISQGEDILRYGLYKTLQGSSKLRPKLENIGISRIPETGMQGLIRSGQE